MSYALAPCAACARHYRSHEPRCPFCAHEPRVALAALRFARSRRPSLRVPLAVAALAGALLVPRARALAAASTAASALAQRGGLGGAGHARYGVPARPLDPGAGVPLYGLSPYGSRRVAQVTALRVLEGRFTRAQASAALRPYVPRLRAIAERSLRNGPAGGSAELELRIDAEGGVLEARTLRSSFGDDFARMFAAAFRSVRFPTVRPAALRFRLVLEAP